MWSYCSHVTDYGIGKDFLAKTRRDFFLLIFLNKDTALLNKSKFSFHSHVRRLSKWFTNITQPKKCLV